MAPDKKKAVKVLTSIWVIVILLWVSCIMIDGCHKDATVNQDFSGTQGVSPWHNQVEDWQYRMDADNTFNSYIHEPPLPPSE